MLFATYFYHFMEVSSIPDMYIFKRHTVFSNQLYAQNKPASTH